MDGRIVYDYQVGSLEGHLLTFIETMGFEGSREEAVKDIIRGIVRRALYLECPAIQGKYLEEAIEKDRKDPGARPTVGSNK